MKKEGGFTLVELLAVIAILGFIVAIAIPLVGNVVENSKTTTAEQQEELVIDAAQMYFLQNDTATTVTVDTLKTGKYLEQKYAGEDDMSITKAEAEAGELTE